MQTTFKLKSGENFAPKTFAVIYFKNGNTIRKANYDSAIDAIYDYSDCVKAEIYKNGTENLASIMIDSAINDIKAEY